MSVSASEFLVRELRRQRTLAGLTQDELGERAHFSGKQVSAVELGTRPPREDYLAAVDRALDTGGLFVRLWADLVKDDAAPVWLREWIEFEREAVLLRWYEPLYVPGLLQTEDYARATLAGGRFIVEEIDRAVASRLDRQVILTREKPPQLVAVVDEAVIRRPVDRPGLMAAQLARLVELAELDHVQLQVVPAETGMYLGMAGQFIIAELPDGDRVAHADNQLTAQIVEQAADVARLSGTWEIVRNEALSRRQSLDLIKEVAKTWT